MIKTHNNTFNLLEDVALAAQFLARETVKNKQEIIGSGALSALICLYASQALKKENIPHQIQAGSSLWRINSEEQEGVISNCYDQGNPVDLSAWIRIDGLIYDPSIGAVIDQKLTQSFSSHWRPDFLMLHEDDTNDPQGVYRYEAGSVHYAPCLRATSALLSARELVAGHNSSFSEHNKVDNHQLTPSLFNRFLACLLSRYDTTHAVPLFI